MKSLCILLLFAVTAVVANAGTCPLPSIGKSYSSNDDGNGPNVTFGALTSNGNIPLSGIAPGTSVYSNAQPIKLGPNTESGYIDIYGGICSGCNCPQDLDYAVTHWLELYDVSTGTAVYTSSRNSDTYTDCGHVVSCAFSVYNPYNDLPDPTTLNLTAGHTYYLEDFIYATIHGVTGQVTPTYENTITLITSSGWNDSFPNLGNWDTTWGSFLPCCSSGVGVTAGGPDGADAVMYYAPPPGYNNGCSAVKVRTEGTGASVYAATRISPNGNSTSYYEAYYGGSDIWLQKFVNGTWGAITSASHSALADGDVLALCSKGSTHTIYVNGAYVTEATDTSISGASYYGVAGNVNNSSGSTINQWQGAVW